MKKILVTGSTGKTGLAIIKKLLEHNLKVKAITYKEEYKEKLFSLGVSEVLIGDMRDKSLWEKAFTSVYSVYHICPNMQLSEITIGKYAISYAEKSKSVEKFVLHSVLHPQTEKMPHHWNKMRVEEALLESSLDWTILQPTAYMQNILAYSKDIYDCGVYSIPYSVNAKISLVDLDDISEVSLKVLTEKKHSMATYELVGDEVITQAEIAEILSEILNKKIIAKEISLENWQNKMKDSTLTKEQINILLKMFDYYKYYNLTGNSNVLKWLLNRSPNTFKNWCKDNFKKVYIN